MEVKYKIMLFVGIALFAILFIATFFPFRKGRSKFKKGKKVANSFYIREEAFFRTRMIVYRILTYTMIFACTLGIVGSTLMLSRPYRTEKTIEEKYTRDIILCIDVSTSVDDLNSRLIDKLKIIVDGMQGERFGLVIFNTSPVLLVPLTNDYEFILNELDRMSDILEERRKSFYVDDEYLTAGTELGWMEKGSSLIGDGLVGAAYCFRDFDEDDERTRLIILSTDNQLAGIPDFTLTKAAEICEDRNILVYGIGTEFMCVSERKGMRKAVESTGGKFYQENEFGSYMSIVSDIERDTKSFIQEEEIVEVTEFVKIPFMCLLAVVATMFVTGKIVKY